jgi:molybdate transport system permease protein
MSGLLTPAEIEALRLSLLIAFWAVLGGLPVAIALAWLLARHRFPGRALLDGIVHLPLVLPPVVVGYGLLVLLGRRGLIGQWLHDALGITLAFTWEGAAVASAVMALPLMVRAIRLSIEAVDRGLEAAAATLGSSRADVFFTITLPLALPGVLIGVVLGFARSLGEFGATITFAGNIAGETRTLANAIYTVTQIPDSDAAAGRLCLIAIVLSLAALLVSEILARRIGLRLQGRDHA